LGITGDVILSSGIIAYMGAFMMTHRDSCLYAWQTILTERKIKFTDNFAL
jgi:dynein heavy chain